ncbi:MAG: hypothetical protein ACLFNK_03630 [Candidatus Woesearchaeota archaeon]
MAGMKMIDKTRWARSGTVMMIVSLLFIITMYGSFASSGFPEDNVLYSSWVLPGRNITVMDDIIQFHGFEGVDDVLMIEVDNQNLTINKGDEARTDDFRFTVQDSRFDIDMLNETGRDGMPWYGEIPKGTDSRFYSFHIMIELMRPVLEFQRSVAGIPNDRGEREIKGRLNEDINVSLEILNHGEEDTEFIHKENFPEDAEIRIHNVSGATAQKKEDHIELQGNTEDKPVLNYSMRIGKDKEFTFDSVSEVTHKGTLHSYHERNKTTLSVDSNIDMMLGFYNGARFRNRDQSTFVGEEEVVGGYIENDKDNPITGKVKIVFPDSERTVINKDTERRYLDEIYEEELQIENGTREEIRFGVSFMRIGEYPIEIILEAETEDGKIEMNNTLTLDVGFDTPEPKAIFNSTDDNSTTDMTLFLQSQEGKEVDELLVDITLSEGGSKEEFFYRYDELRLPENFLLNSMSRKIMNSSIFTVEFNGSLRTIFGDTIDFNENISVEDGFTEKYRNKRSEIMDNNNLDERYENPSNYKQPTRFTSFMLTIAGMVTSTDEDDTYPITAAVILFMIILSIQFLLFRKNRKRKR